MAERDISDEVYHRVRQLEQSFGVNWPILLETIGFLRISKCTTRVKNNNCGSYKPQYHCY